MLFVAVNIDSLGRSNQTARILSPSLNIICLSWESTSTSSVVHVFQVNTGKCQIFRYIISLVQTYLFENKLYNQYSYTIQTYVYTGKMES